jgi:hypothetical protein
MFGLELRKSTQYPLEIDLWVDADFANSTEDRKSISGMILIVNKNTIMYQSKKQSIVSLSTCESEFVSMASGIQSLLWFVNLLDELKIPYAKPKIKCDNQATIKYVRNPNNVTKNKHISIKYNFVRDSIQEKFDLEYVASNLNLADVLTKPLPRSLFVPLRENLRVVEILDLAHREDQQ